MSKDQVIKSVLNEQVNMTPTGIVADELSPEQFEVVSNLFISKILDISKSDISQLSGYGEFTAKGTLRFKSLSSYVEDCFDEKKEGYWYNWREMFNTTILDKEFFEQYYAELVALLPYSEGQRYLVNNNTFFVNMVTDGIKTVGFSDWSRAGVMDFLIDFAIVDLNKPYLKIPERLFAYCNKEGINIPKFKERFLCMAYYKGLDTLRWHASIDDIESCTSIKQSISELEARLNAL